MPPPPPPPGVAAPPPPPPQPVSAPAYEQAIAQAPEDWGTLPVGGPSQAGGRSISVGWSVAALVGCVLSILGAFLPLVSVGDRSFSRSDGRGIDVVAPWKVSERYSGVMLFERWDIAVALLLAGIVAAVLLLALRRQAWPAAIGAVLAALAFHLQLSLLERAERGAMQQLRSPSYQIGGIFLVGGALLALVGFIAVLARRH